MLRALRQEDLKNFMKHSSITITIKIQQIIIECKGELMLCYDKTLLLQSSLNFKTKHVTHETYTSHQEFQLRTA